jgi:deoxyribonuclease-4
MRIGAHVDPADPLAEAKARDADVVQFFLSDPQGWKAPPDHPHADALRAAAGSGEVRLYVHAPYTINLASQNNRIRIPSRKILDDHAKAAAGIGASGLIVHGGHVTADDDIAAGFDAWRKAFAKVADKGGFPLPILIENTAGGDHAIARRFDNLARLWDAIGDYEPGFCLDTCHAFCGGEELAGVVDRVTAITGRIDSGRDRHDNFASGQIDPELIAAVVRDAGAAGATAVVVETPGDGHPADIAFLRERIAP